jgi:polyisoprenoid-binding protein YceI
MIHSSITVNVRRQRAPYAVLAVLFLLLAACSPASSGQPTPPANTAGPAAATLPTPTAPAAGLGVANATQLAPTSAAADAEPAAAGSDRLRLVLVPERSEARYRVREQLANMSLPNDAVGVTNGVSGAIVVAQDGTVFAEESRFTVDLRTLQSDVGMRDGFIQRNTLQTSQYPTIEFVPTMAVGLPSPLPTSGQVMFQLQGNMLLRGVTRPTTWDVTAEVRGQTLVGRAVTQFTFGDFEMEIPRVARVLSIEDLITLELDFQLEADNG